MKKALVDVNRKIALKLRKRNNAQHEQVSHTYSESDVTTARTSVMVEWRHFRKMELTAMNFFLDDLTPYFENSYDLFFMDSV